MPQDIISQFDRKYNSPIETYRLLSDTNARNSIPAAIRWEGMLCYVIADATTYVLVGGINNTNWQALGDGGGTAATVLRKSLAVDAASAGGSPTTIQDETFATSEIAVGDVVEYYYYFSSAGSGQTIQLRVGSFISTGITSLPVGNNKIKGTITFTAIGANGSARVSWEVMEANGNFINIAFEDSGTIDLSSEVLTGLLAGGTNPGDITLKSGTIKLFKL